jgi:hypothetical protein
MGYYALRGFCYTLPQGVYAGAGVARVGACVQSAHLGRACGGRKARELGQRGVGFERNRDFSPTSAPS